MTSSLFLLYVDDMLLTRTSKRIVHEINEKLARKFAMKDLELANKILGMMSHKR